MFDEMLQEVAARDAAVEDAAKREACAFVEVNALAWAEGYKAEPFALTDDEIEAALGGCGDDETRSRFLDAYADALTRARLYCEAQKPVLDAAYESDCYQHLFDRAQDRVEVEAMAMVMR
jgi:hypothetical protein